MIFSKLSSIRLEILKYLFPYLLLTMLIPHYFDVNYFLYGIFPSLLPLILSVKKCYFLANMLFFDFLLRESIISLYFSYGLLTGLTYGCLLRLCIGDLQTHIFSLIFFFENITLFLSSYVNVDIFYDFYFLCGIFQFLNILLLKKIPIDSLEITQTKFLPVIYEDLKKLFQKNTSTIYLNTEYKTILEVVYEKHRDNYNYIIFNSGYFFLPLLIKNILWRSIVLILSVIPVRKFYFGNILFFSGLFLGLPPMIFLGALFSKWVFPLSWKRRMMVLASTYRLVVMWSLYNIFS